MIITGTAIECARHYRAHCQKKRDFAIMKLFAEWSKTSYGGSVLYWFKGDYAPNGINLLRLQIFLGLLGYDVTELRVLHPSMLKFGKAIAFGVIDTAGAALLLDLNEQSINRLFLGKSGTSDTRLSLIEDFVGKNADAISEKEKDLCGKIASLTTVDESLPKLTMVPPKKTDPGIESVSSKVKIGIIETFAAQVNAMLPMAQLIASDSFSPAERESLRQRAGKFNVFNLKNALVMLCGERAREEGIQKKTS